MTSSMGAENGAGKPRARRNGQHDTRTGISNQPCGAGPKRRGTRAGTRGRGEGGRPATNADATRGSSRTIHMENDGDHPTSGGTDPAHGRTDSTEGRTGKGTRGADRCPAAPPAGTSGPWERPATPGKTRWCCSTGSTRWGTRPRVTPWPLEISDRERPGVDGSYLAQATPVSTPDRGTVSRGAGPVRTSSAEEHPSGTRELPPLRAQQRNSRLAAPRLADGVPRPSLRRPRARAPRPRSTTVATPARERAAPLLNPPGAGSPERRAPSPRAERRSAPCR